MSDPSITRLTAIEIARREGAEIALTYQNERFRDRAQDMAKELGAKVALPCEVTDDAEIARLAARGLTPETDPSVLIDGPGPIICCQRREGPRLERNRIHLDLHTADRKAEVTRLIGLGATLWYEKPQFTVLRDPEGNQFCLVDIREAMAA